MRAETRKHLESVGADEEQFVKALRMVFPHGHEDFLPTTIAEMELHSVKNHDYAKGGDSLGNFTRVAAILALYPGLDLSDRRVVALAYALKQLDAVLWGLCKKIAHKVEGLNERLGDISIYAKIVMCMNTEDARNAEIDRQFAQDKALENARVNAALKMRAESDHILSQVRVSAAGRETQGCCAKEAAGPMRRFEEAGYDTASKVPDLNTTRSAENATCAPIRGAHAGINEIRR